MTNTVSVSNTTQLVAAMKAALNSTTPETIVLQAGTYTPLSIYNYNFKSTVTLQSASTTNEAVLDGFTINNSSNLTIQNMTISGAATPISPYGAVSTGEAAENTHVSFLDNDSKISLSHLTCVGVAGGDLANTPSFLEIENSSSIAINNSTFTDFHYAIGFQNVNGMSVVNNSFSYIFDDGIRGGGLSNGLINDNTFTSMHMDPTDTDHPDCIQLWTSGDTTSESNITITDNTYTRGAGTAVQGIFVTDQVGDLPYINITIEGNNIQGAGYNGITVEDAQNATIEDNIVQPYADQPSYMTLESLSSGTVSGNAVGLMKWLGTSSVSEYDNTTLAAIAVPSATALASGISSVAPVGSVGSGMDPSALANVLPNAGVVTVPAHT